MNLSYGGETLNSAVHLARQGIGVNYVAALGDDPMSAWMVEHWRGEGLGCDLVDFHAGEVPGIYLIETDDQGERSFYYWRESAPARRLLDEPDSAVSCFPACGTSPGCASQGSRWAFTASHPGSACTSFWPRTGRMAAKSLSTVTATPNFGRARRVSGRPTSQYIA
ncbi:PfkB family carbohydrate kinase [Seongchinamella unica]|uniref:PfkB family carbohydrate kinase n=1 Tax=Seongchinamella unica TaxID=2547392 RepID=UPI001EED15BC|nr:PfkB family carbohydrate kinase [Seongchinamella unica]